MKLTQKDKRELGYKLNDVFSQLEDQMKIISSPDLEKVREMTVRIEDRKKMLEEKLNAIKSALEGNGIKPKPRPKPRKKNVNRNRRKHTSKS